MSENSGPDKKLIKCVVWDLDNTLWNGVLLEGDTVSLRPGVLELIAGLDERGILQSIASKNDHGLAMAKLKEFGIDEYFLYGQINWNSKASSIKTISESINIALDSVAFIDDQTFEREEVSYTHSEVLCIDAADIDRLLDLPQMNPRFITDDSRSRRKMYVSDLARKQAEGTFVGTQTDFLASLEMRITISPAGREDLKRAEELTIRTNQLNTTGYTYSFEELAEFIDSEHYELLICELEDKYGAYGKIGLALTELKREQHILKLLLMSCRVMSRGVGAILINYIMGRAKSAGVGLVAEYIANERNRMMYVTLKFAGFREIMRSGKAVLLESDLSRLQEFPAYIDINVLKRGAEPNVSNKAFTGKRSQ
jgi:FkbH-like protein